RLLEFLEDVFVPLQLARHVRQRPDRHAGFALALAERSDADAQPAAGLALVRADAHLLLPAPPLAGRPEQPIDRLRNPGIADEDPLDRPHVAGVGGLDQGPVGGIGIEYPPARIGDHDALAGAVEHRLDERIARLATRGAQN